MSDFFSNLDHPFVYFFIENPVILVRNKKEQEGKKVGIF